MAKRAEWVDMAKAIGMIAVVLGHAIHPLVADPKMSTLFSVIYWWHMPLFFIIGGFFLKPLTKTWAGFRAFFKKRIVPNLKSYFLAGSILILISHFIRGHSWKYTLFYFVRLVYGGRTLNHDLSIFWFMTVYILTVIVVELIITWVDSVPAQFFIAMTLYMTGMTYKHMEFFQYKYVPWDADIVLLTTLYMLCGYYGFKYYNKIPHKNYFIAATMAIYAILIIYKYRGILRFSLYLKSHNIANSFLGLFIPLIVCFMIFMISDWMMRVGGLFKWLLPFGWYSSAIMYMHKMVLDAVAMVPILNHWEIQWVAGLIIPVQIAMSYHRLRLAWTLRKETHMSQS
ncbi:hypothetical protein AYR62_02135 [Secundilactobacillus paracollinoides]|uniref:Acyltransferase 3 domain-containing protein n=1 Tax=Secundilactobacillus paracollinoides TaxID=240427 RepID=A0A1B2IUS7_9LACO|nr:acyltransferase [Secundilactobacillus paracollinoides]ANZ60024.1 hypothetical protein AYR61_00790 [Secundilactobacillus paracollinoides]ANZ63022.1 hypothetical protein AYR62_02135 [Secundilactobacillus paracollinoides]ANZ65816.1 hypothetical protein AYR63_00800 [Secundilactobacillus paracollinoides]